MPQRNVTITPQQDEFVNILLSTGEFGNVSEIFRTALRLLEHEEQQKAIEAEILHKSIQAGVEDIQAGRYTHIKNRKELAKFFAEKRNARTEWLEGQ